MCSFLSTQSGLIRVGDVKEAVCVFSLLVDLTHESISLQEVSAVHEEVKRASLWKLDPLSDDVVEVVGREIVWNQVPVRVDRDQKITQERNNLQRRSERKWIGFARNSKSCLMLRISVDQG